MTEFDKKALLEELEAKDLNNLNVAEKQEDCVYLWTKCMVTN